MRYQSHGGAARAYERVISKLTARRSSGDSAYRCLIAGRPTVAVLSWNPTPEHLAAVAALPWGEGESVIVPARIGQQLAARSLQAAPQLPNRIRRVFRDPTGRVLSDRELPDD
jgi:hypothetical protein